jgi:hypothetical protein
VILFGPPGSGKTTTLIKRLAQKRTPDALTDGEERIMSGYIRENLLRADSWAMFSPAELLKKYLGEAFNQEGVPDAGNVRTWDKERHDLARNVLGILRSNTSGRFQLEANRSLLIDGSSRGIANLHDEFAAHVEENLLKRCNDALAILVASDDEDVKEVILDVRRALGSGKQLVISDVLRLFDQAEALQSEIKRLNDQISDDLKKVINQLLNAHRKLLDELVVALPAIRVEEEDEAEEDTEEMAEAVPAAATADSRLEGLNILMQIEKDNLRNRRRHSFDFRSWLSGRRQSSTSSNTLTRSSSSRPRILVIRWCSRACTFLLSKQAAGFARADCLSFPTLAKEMNSSSSSGRFTILVSRHPQKTRSGSSSRKGVCSRVSQFSAQSAPERRAAACTRLQIRFLGTAQVRKIRGSEASFSK